MDVFLGTLSNPLDFILLEAWWDSGKGNQKRIGNVFMIACDDLEKLCSVILEVHQYLYGTYLRSRDHTVLLVDVVNCGDQGRTCLKDGSIPLDAKVQRLLKPFKRLHSISKIHISGDMNEQYRSEIVASMMKEPPTAEVMIDMACATKADGDEASRNGDCASSVSAYEKAHSDIEAGHQPSFPFALVAKGRYAGGLVSSAKEHLTFTLRLDIVAALLKLGEYRNASNWGSMELLVHEGVISNAEFARMWQLRSQASTALGRSKVAYHELVQAVLLQPKNKDMAADLGNMTANVLVSSTALLRWASSDRKEGAGQA